MHPNNVHLQEYPIETLCALVPELEKHLQSFNKKLTIDFANAEAVFLLNKALLLRYYGVKDWELPETYLCPPIPGRVDYVHHLADLIKKPNARGLDIGTGASLIYPLLAASVYGWTMKGVDVDETAFTHAKKNLFLNPQFKDHIAVALQPDRGSIFKGVISENERFDFTMCNPPFYSSAEEAEKANFKKNRNLKNNTQERNFSGVSTELYCNGGEALFVKRMIKESILFKNQVGWFTTLISKSEHLPKLRKQLEKLGATYQTIAMEQGNKKSRILAWTFAS